MLGFTPESLAQKQIGQAPRLVVNITIDQLRSDYLEAYAPLYCENGFKRLLAQGLVYPNASYNFQPVDRASSVASVATGTSPYYHGIVGLEWFNKETLRSQNCVRDKQFGYSPLFLGTSTIGDEMKIASKGTALVFSFAPFADAAILSAGHAADGVAWANDTHWSTSAYYQPISSWLSASTRLFATDQDVNKSVTDLALKCVEQAGIGLDDKTDLINITYTPGTELLEAYMNIDKQLAVLVQGVENRLGRDRVLFVLTSTGYSNEEEETENEKYRIPTGKLNLTRTANLLNMYLGAVYGSAHYVEACYKNHIYLNRKWLDQKNINVGEAMKRSQEFLLQISGIRNVYTSDQLLTGENYVLAKIRNGFNVEKSGDLIIDAAPGWKIINEETGESSLSRAGYVAFPIIFYGANIKAERVLTPVTADRIAPTIAKSIRIRAPNACSSEPLF